MPCARKAHLMVRQLERVSSCGSACRAPAAATLHAFLAAPVARRPTILAAAIRTACTTCSELASRRRKVVQHRARAFEPLQYWLFST